MIYDPRYLKLSKVESSDTRTLYEATYTPEHEPPVSLDLITVGQMSPETGYVTVLRRGEAALCTRYFDLDYFTFPDTPERLRYHAAALLSVVTGVDSSNEVDRECVGRIATRIRRGLTRAKGPAAYFDLFGEMITGTPFDLFGESATNSPYDSCLMRLRTDLRGLTNKEIRQSLISNVFLAWTAFNQACHTVTVERPQGEYSDVLFAYKYKAVVQRLGDFGFSRSKK